MNGDVPTPKKRNWIAIVLGVLLLFGILGVGCVVITVSWFRQNLSVTTAGEEAAMQQLDDVRSRFPGQQPLIQLVDGKPELVAERATQAASQTSLSTLHVIAFDTDEGNLVSFSLPFWLLRMKSGGSRFSMGSGEVDLEKLRLTVEDLERFGPTLILDHKDRKGARVLVWSQ